MKITLVRHTSLQISPGLCYGQSDIDVGVSFWDETNQLKNKLADRQFDAVYTSPLQRCVKLAAALNLGEPIEDARLMGCTPAGVAGRGSGPTAPPPTVCRSARPILPRSHATSPHRHDGFRLHANGSPPSQHRSNCAYLKAGRSGL